MSEAPDVVTTGAATRDRRRTQAWSVDALNSRVGYLLRRAQLVVSADFREALAELDLRPGQFTVLVVIDRNPGLTQSQVGNALGIDRANFVAVIKGLEARGLVARTASSHDRRSKGLALTAAGRRLLQRALRVHDLHEQRIVRRLGAAGRERLVELLARLANLT